MKTHPAKALFRKLFTEAAKGAEDNPQLPTYYVPRNHFHALCRKEGIDIPAGFVAAVQWEEEIGLPEFTHRIFAKHHKEHGTDFTPGEKAAWRQRQRMKRNA